MNTGFHPKVLLRATRFVAATALVWVVLPAISMPDGYMGAHDEMTWFGVFYSLGLVVAVALGLVGMLRREEWSTYLVSSVYSANVAIFVPAVAADPVKATLVVLWQGLALAIHLLETDESRPIRAVAEVTGQDRRIENWYETFGPSARHLLVCGVVLTLLVVGHGISNRWTAVLVCASIHAAAFATLLPFFREQFAAGRWQLALALLPFAGLAFVPLSISAILVASATAAPLLLVALVAESPLFQGVLEYFYDYPTLLIVAAFSGVITLGVLLLTLPQASTGAGSISPIDALFTSTSATCVTGLIVLDTPHDFTFFGQAVILGLIQIGGLGIMVLSTFAAVALGSGLGTRGEQALGELLDTSGVRSAYRLTRFVVATTFAVETVGAVLLTLGYRTHGSSWSDAVWEGIFHSISAFCNAGFALRSDSIRLFRRDPAMLAVFSTLVIVGGIGFIVLATVWARWRQSQRPRFQTHASMVLTATGLLLVAGALLYGMLEWSASLGDLSTGHRITNAIFQSVTLRTAGFNSVSFDTLRDSTTVVMLAFMFVGAAPGSTGGGVKVTTVAVLYGVVRSIGLGRSRVVFFGRRIPDDIVYRSVAIVTIALTIVVGGATVLFTLEDIAFRSLLFETVSALGTVGLSIGATGEFGSPGKLVVVVLMFLGRTGPLSLAVLLGRGSPPDVDYPSNRILVG